MKRRSRAGGEPITGRRQKTPEPKSGNAPKAVARSKSALTQEETEVARLTRELNEAREQQTATSDVLRAISASLGEVQPVFQAILQKAVRICGAHFGNMFLYEDDAYRTVAMHNAPEAYANIRWEHPFHPPPGSGLGRLMATKGVVQIADTMSDLAPA